MSRKANFTSKQIDAIENLIHSWDSGKITWEAIIEAAKPIIGDTPSRSGLSSHASIQAAFTARKKGLSAKPAGRTPSPNSLADASRIIAARNNEIAALKQQVNDYREKFDRWRYNAMLLNVVIDKLDQPLPAINRSGQ